MFELATNKSENILSSSNDSEEFDGISFAPDGKSVVVSGSRGTRVWDNEKRAIVADWKNPEFNFFGLLSPKGNYFISGGGRFMVTNPLRFAVTVKRRSSQELTDFRDGVLSLSISNNEKYFALAGGTYGGENAGFIGLWSLSEFEELGFAAFGDAPIKAIGIQHRRQHASCRWK